MNILRLVQAEKEKKNKPPSNEFKALEDEATANYRDRGQQPIRIAKVELRKTLNPMQYHVTQEKGTERFENTELTYLLFHQFIAVFPAVIYSL